MDTSARPAGPRRTSDVIRGVLWFIASLVCFLAMAIAVRDLSDTMNAFEVLTWRAIVGLLVTLPFLMRRGMLAPFRTRRPGLHGIRNFIHFFGQASWVYALSFISFVDVTAIEFSIPIFAALLAPLILGERVDAHRWGAIVVGFIGVVIALRPGVGAMNPAALIMVAGAVCYAGSAVLVKLLTRTDSAGTIVLYMNLMQLPLAVGLAVWVGWVDPTLADVPAILVLGIGGVLAHYMIARGLALADVTILYPLDFLRLPFMALIGYFLYAEGMDLWVVVGAVVIFASNLYLVQRGARDARLREARAEAA